MRLVCALFSIFYKFHRKTHNGYFPILFVACSVFNFLFSVQRACVWICAKKKWKLWKNRKKNIKTKKDHIVWCLQVILLLSYKLFYITVFKKIKIKKNRNQNADTKSRICLFDFFSCLRPRCGVWIFYSFYVCICSHDAWKMLFFYIHRAFSFHWTHNNVEVTYLWRKNATKNKYVSMNN